ncbi:hypothetical protein B5M42_011485 [Paenibacillus athensensis]|uniref:hypothetical protein n=1 Tax=Paenibacillus athensensis TaxID=1967502 RepID=UPI0010704019|nr:hypothetical protein [Paenibacillus athensensis]MCD1259456.1 hypothetical protein [Paenibacillus athensensis]
MGDFPAWLKLTVDLSGNPDPNPIRYCPECESDKIDFQYVGDPSSRIGFLSIWCENCLNGIHISRVKAPKSAELLAFGDANVKERIPHFKQVMR